MKRDKLIKKVASQLNLNEIEVACFIGSVFDTMAAVLSKGKNINIPEFGKFIVREKKTEGTLTKYISFSPSKKFAEEINRNFSDLSPVVIKTLNIGTLEEIRVTEIEDVTEEKEFVEFVFDETETDIQFQAPAQEKETPETVNKFIPLTPETIQALDDEICAPYLIPVMRSPSHTPPVEKPETKFAINEEPALAEDVTVFNLPDDKPAVENIPVDIIALEPITDGAVQIDELPEEVKSEFEEKDSIPPETNEAEVIPVSETPDEPEQFDEFVPHDLLTDEVMPETAETDLIAQETDEIEVIPISETSNEPEQVDESVATDSLTDEVMPETTETDLIVQETDESEVIPVTEIAEEPEKIIETPIPEEPVQLTGEDIMTVDDTGVEREENKEKDKAELIEEKIITEKEIILRDIEEYIKSKEEAAGNKEENEEEDKDSDDNLFIKSNVFTEYDHDNNFAVEDIKNSDVKPQNIFEDESITDETYDAIQEQPTETELEQNVFSDLEDFFNSENGTQKDVKEPDGEAGGGATLEKEENKTESENVFPKDRHGITKSFMLKDNTEVSDLDEEILLLLMSREKAIHDLGKYGLELTPESKQQETEEKAKQEEQADTGIKEENKIDETHAGFDFQETAGEDKTAEETIISGDFSFDMPLSYLEPEIEEDKESIYDELNKRIAELEELSAKKQSIEEELKQNIVSPEMNIFDKLVEDKQEPVTEKPAAVFPEIIIHDPGDKYEEAAPKSLSEALESVSLDGIIEHLEHSPTIVEEKSYDDVFKPADIPFIPISNPEHVIKKQNKYLKFLLYFFFVVIFSIMSFFLYKSILTPNRKTPVDTLGVKVNDSIASTINLIDTGLKTGSIILNEFEVEKEGDIIYKQTDNGYIIQIAKFDKYSEALKYVSGLDNKNIHAEIERVDLPLNVTEYRIIVGTFETLQEAKSYFKNSSMMLNYIKVLTPFKTTLSF